MNNESLNMSRHIAFFCYGICCAILVLGGGCQNLRTDNSEEIITKRDRMYTGYGKFFGEDALLFGGEDRRQKQPHVEIGVNSYLWRSTLDTLAFMPLQVVDPQGGVITTDWYTDPSAPNEQTRINVRILDRVLRADALTVSIFRQQYKGNRWVPVPVAPKTVYQIENAILKRARHLKSIG